MNELTAEYAISISRAHTTGAPAFSGTMLLWPTEGVTGTRAQFEFTAVHDGEALNIEVGGSAMLDALIADDGIDSEPILDLFAAAVTRAITQLEELEEASSAELVATDSSPHQDWALASVADDRPGILWPLPQADDRVTCSMDGTVYAEGPLMSALLQVMACNDGRSLEAATGTDVC